MRPAPLGAAAPPFAPESARQAPIGAMGMRLRAHQRAFLGANNRNVLYCQNKTSSHRTAYTLSCQSRRTMPHGQKNFPRQSRRIATLQFPLHPFLPTAYSKAREKPPSFQNTREE